MTPRTSIAFSVLENIFVVCAGDDPPTDEEFNQMVQTISSLDSDVTGILVRAGNRRPNSAQRSEMVSLLKRRKLDVAMVSDSRLARGAITAIGWFVKGVKSFKVSEMERALGHLKVDGMLAAQILPKIQELESSLTRRETGAGGAS